ncbi:MAG: hypothetical protein C4341_03375 [Armatimonadota bacterium]
MQRMRALVSSFGFVALWFAVPSTSTAQGLPGFGVQVRVGYFWPANSRAAAGKSQWFTVGTEFKVLDDTFLMRNPLTPGHFSFSADLMEGNGFRSVPLLLNYNLRVLENLTASAGGGISFTSRPGFKDNTSFAYQASLVYDWAIQGFPILVRLAWNGVSSVDEELDGFSLTAGVKF